MVRNIDTKVEELQLSYSIAQSPSDNENNSVRDSIILNTAPGTLFERLQTFSHAETVTLFDEDLYITRYDGKEVDSFLQICDIPSYIIIEKMSEMQVKTVRTIGEWDNVEASSTPKRSISHTTSTPCSELDTTGSPLRCPFQNVESDPCLNFQEPESVKRPKAPLKIYHGFSPDKARSIASNLRLALKALKGSGVDLPPVWIACNGKDHLKTMFIGLHANKNGNSTCSVTSSGVFNEVESLPTIDAIISHFAFGSRQPRLSTKVEAVYEVVSQDERTSLLHLTCRWTRPLSTLCSPARDAVTIANLHLDLSDEKSPAYFLFLEFEILRNLIDGLKDKCLTWYRRKREKSVTETLQDYFLKFNLKDEKSKDTRDMVSLEKIMENIVLKMPSIMEFTDKMWDILKESESLSELTDGFKEVFKNIAAGTIRPRIHIRNDTEFSVICRDLVKGHNRDPTLDQWQPIKMLVEIGLEKIKKDYVAIFEGNYLATTEQVAPYVTWSTKTQSFDECLTKLKKLQAVLQIVVNLRTTLDLPNSVLCHFTSKTLLDLENETDLPKDFEFQVDTASVKSIVDCIVPTGWSYEMWSKIEDDKSGLNKWMKFMVNKGEPFFKLESEGEKNSDLLVNEDESSQADENTFYCLLVSKTGDIFF